MEEVPDPLEPSGLNLWLLQKQRYPFTVLDMLDFPDVSDLVSCFWLSDCDTEQAEIRRCCSLKIIDFDYQTRRV